MATIYETRYNFHPDDFKSYDTERIRKEFLVEKGDTIWVPKKAIHWLYNPFDDPFEMLCVYSKASLKEAGLVVHE